jgi:hypothetical protein
LTVAAGTERKRVADRKRLFIVLVDVLAAVERLKKRGFEFYAVVVRKRDSEGWAGPPLAEPMRREHATRSVIQCVNG